MTCFNTSLNNHSSKAANQQVFVNRTQKKTTKITIGLIIFALTCFNINTAHAQTAYSYFTNNEFFLNKADKNDSINSSINSNIDANINIDNANNLASSNETINQLDLDSNPVDEAAVLDSKNLDTFFEKITNTSKSTFNTASKVTNSVLHATQSLIGNALGLLGVPYRYGGNTAEQGLDCSGFVKLVFAQTLGIILPRRASDMGKLGFQVGKSDLEPGDLVFFNTMQRINSHVGIYIGGGEFVHSPSTGGRVRVEKLTNSYWKQRFEWGKRITHLTK
jgi:cell wall-associated NlpC family hydrolase